MKFVANKPAMIIGKYLVVSDIHIGVETQYWRSGFRIMSHVKSVSEEIVSMMEKNRLKGVVLNGDIKDNIAFPSRREEKYLSEFYSSLSSYDVISIKGNHDGGIERFADTVDSWSWKKTLVTHGHKRMEGEWKRIVIGHNHPVMTIRDRLGSTYTQRVWLVSDDMVVMPAFNPLAGGHEIREGMQGPYKRDGFRIYLLNGIEVDVDGF